MGWGHIRMGLGPYQDGVGHIGMRWGHLRVDGCAVGAPMQEKSIQSAIERNAEATRLTGSQLGLLARDRDEL